MTKTAINFKTIAVDFDGTLCYSEWPDCGQPNLALITHLRQWKQDGNKLILWTCRAGKRCRKQSNGAENITWNSMQSTTISLRSLNSMAATAAKSPVIIILMTGCTFRIL